MSSLRFRITIRGGEADAKQVDATTVAKILRGVAADIRAICRNTSPEVTAEEIRDACRLFVSGEPDPSESLAFPCVVGARVTAAELVELGARSANLYFDGIEEMSGDDWDWQEIRLPKGFDADVLSHVDGYFKHLELGQSLSFDVEQNGAALRSVPLSDQLRRNVELTTALLRKTREDLAAIAPSTEKHSIQGVMYEIDDYYYDDERAKLRFEVDPHDGTRWVCEIERKDAPPNLAELWKSTVLVEGIATFRPDKPKMTVERFIHLGTPDPAEALERLRKLAPDLMKDETSEELMARLRGPEWE